MTEEVHNSNTTRKSIGLSVLFTWVQQLLMLRGISPVLHAGGIELSHLQNCRGLAAMAVWQCSGVRRELGADVVTRTDGQGQFRKSELEISEKNLYVIFSETYLGRLHNTRR